ncbi:MAG: PQQ-dependent sugar dehydrogenase [Gammaproteobacteria bacterium]|nr:PQQ-dependent sugar dehydrogenase [Gammaproteobacteria bacterium]
MKSIRFLPIKHNLILVISAFLTLGCQAAERGESLGIFDSDDANFEVTVVANDLEMPWGMTFIPDGRMLFTERHVGRMSLLNLKNGKLVVLKGVPEVHAQRQGGLLDVILHPDYKKNGWIYFAYSATRDGMHSTFVDRARLNGDTLVDREEVFVAQPFFRQSHHFGSRLVIDADNYLFITVGDRGNRDRAQDLTTHNGKVIRLHDDGRVPDDNPFVGRDDARDEIWSYGHRNMQGLTLHPETGELWGHEHGPKGGDEINIIEPGKNYGWRIITYGEEYRGGKIGDGITEKEGMEQPLKYYVPSIAPSGMVFYTGDAFPNWQGDLFIGALALTHINRLVFKDNNYVVKEERLLDDENWRVRVVRQGPDGNLYIGVDSGMILRLQPVVAE